MEIDLIRILRKLESAGASEAEVSMWRSRRKRFSFSEEPGEATDIDKISLSMRAIIGKRIGVIGVEDLSEEGVEKAIEKVISIAKNSPEDPNWKGLNKDFGRGSISGVVYNKNILEIEFGELEMMYKEIKEGISEACREARVTRGSISLSMIEYQYFSSYLNDIMKRVESSFGVYALARADIEQGTGTFSDFIIGRDIRKDLDLQEFGKNIGSKAREFTKARKTETGKYTVVLDQVVSGAIISTMLSPAISSENVFRGRSPLANKLGSMVFNEKISIEDNGLVGEYIGAREFDDEGVAVRMINVIERGLLRNFLYDSYYANLMNTRSTGNAWRSLSSSPRPSHNVLVLRGGDMSLEDLIREVSRGIYVVRVIGEWLSNPVSGFVQATITHAYEIANGEIRGPLRGGTMTTNFYKGFGEEFLHSSKELRILDRVVAPHIAMRGVTIS
ncbi:MAG: TldD/PmbA family protein [Sulfolobales archaeon]